MPLRRDWSRGDQQWDRRLACRVRGRPAREPENKNPHWQLWPHDYLAYETTADDPTATWNPFSGSLAPAPTVRYGTNWSFPLTSAYYHADGNGNVTALVGTNGAVEGRYSYDPYGGVLTMSGAAAAANTQRFSSKEWCAQPGLYYYGFRCYDPNLQRWVNRDPIEEEGGINLFGFVGNDPVNLFDPYGLCPPDGSDGGDTGKKNPVQNVMGEVLGDQVAKKLPKPLQNLKKAAGVAGGWSDADAAAQNGLKKKDDFNNRKYKDDFEAAEAWDHSPSNTNGMGGLDLAGLDAGSAAAKATAKTVTSCGPLAGASGSYKFFDRLQRLFSPPPPRPPKPNPPSPPVNIPPTLPGKVPPLIIVGGKVYG